MIKKALFVFGTRPEAIKMAPVIAAFKESQFYDVIVCVSGQHKEMLYQVLDFFGIVPDYDLEVMKPNQGLTELTSNILLKLNEVLISVKPDVVFVHGDTTTSFVGALASYYNHIDVVHVEAGLRTFKRYSPFPEELNRTLTASLAKLHMAPTENSRSNLLSEGISDEDIEVTGNTVIDALLKGVEIVNSANIESIVAISNQIKFDSLVKNNKKIVLVTAHRRENHGEGFVNICNALFRIAKEESVHIIFPVHLNPNVQKVVYEKLSNIGNITLLDPLPYEQFLWVMDKSYLIITDSGGIQEEAPSLGKPVLVLRNTTERPEAVDVGTVKLVGTNEDAIVTEALSLILNKGVYDNMCKLNNPYGDGKASLKILESVNRHYGF